MPECVCAAHSSGRGRVRVNVRMSGFDKRVLISIVCSVRWHGVPPTVRELAAELQVSTATVWRSLQRLQVAKRIRVAPRKHRGLSVVSQ